MKETDYLREQARQCRKQVGQAATPPERRALRQLADHYEMEARQIEAGGQRAIH
jgi:hypothetical protein